MLKALSFATVPFEINVLSYVFAILGVFGIVGISMLLSTSKARHESVVDVLKEDIC
jgi:ABC-type antimicrobial peptide transport system permease subunit